MQRRQDNYQLPHPNEDIPPFFEPIIQFYSALPPITRTWFTLSFVTTALHTLDIFETNQLILLWDRIPPPQLELWRILTSFAWAGPGTLVDFPVLMLLYSMVVVVPGYEKDPHDACWIENEGQQQQQQQQHQEEDIPNNSEAIRDRIINRWTTRRSRPKHSQSDCIFASIVCAILILLSYLAITETTIIMHLAPLLPIPHPILMPIFTRTLLYSIITLHSLKHPDQQQNINFFPIPGKYVPLFHVGFGIMMGYRINETIHGIAVGLMYAFLVKEESWLAVAIGRKRLINTPKLLIHLVGEEGNVVTEEVVANVPGLNRNPRLEPGANVLHNAAAAGRDVFIQRQIDQVEGLTSPAEISAATAPFRQQDRNGWQPLHEAARGGHFNVLKLLLEVDEVENEPSRRWRRRAGKLRININARTNNDRGYTALRLVEENHGADNECALLLRELGGVSLGFGDGNGNINDQ